MFTVPAGRRAFAGRSARSSAARAARRPVPSAMEWARLVLRPEVLPNATYGQALLARRLAGA